MKVLLAASILFGISTVSFANQPAKGKEAGKKEVVVAKEDATCKSSQQDKCTVKDGKCGCPDLKNADDAKHCCDKHKATEAAPTTSESAH